MYTMLGWVLLAGLPLSSPVTNDTVVHAPARPPVAAGRVAVWSDRDDPYDRGDAARVYLSAQEAAHVAVFRVDTDGRVRVLFPREPWGDTWVRKSSRLEVPGGRGGRTFVVDDDPGIGYLFAISSRRPFDFDDIALGDHWDYRAIDGGRITGDPYVALTNLATRITPGDDYDYDVSPYYVETTVRLPQVRLLRLPRLREVRRVGPLSPGLRQIPGGRLRRPPLLPLSPRARPERGDRACPSPRAALRVSRLRPRSRIRHPRDHRWWR